MNADPLFLKYALRLTVRMSEDLQEALFHTFPDCTLNQVNQSVEPRFLVKLPSKIFSSKKRDRESCLEDQGAGDSKAV